MVSESEILACVWVYAHVYFMLICMCREWFMVIDCQVSTMTADEKDTVRKQEETVMFVLA